MASAFPQEVLVAIFHNLPIKDRCRLACISQSWATAAQVDSVSLKLKESYVPDYLHVALPDSSTQQQAAACPIMSLARSADITWASAATGSLLQSMPSLERLAFTSMNSMPLDAASDSSGLQRLSSLKNLQSLQLNVHDAGPVLEAVPSVPGTLKSLELHLTGDNWQSNVLDKIATQLGSQASQLQSLVLRCSHASVYAATESMESLSKLAALTSLRMGPNPEDIFPHSSPLGFPRLPSFLGSLVRLQQIDICMADSATVASLSGLDFTPLQHIPHVKITLRADTSIRAVAHLPASLSRLTGLTQLTVQGFTFEDPGGWCTTAYFDMGVLASNRRLKTLDLQLVTWECEHCEGFELQALDRLTQLHSLNVCVAAPAAVKAAGGSSGGGSSSASAGSSGGGGSDVDGPELLLVLPLLKPAHKVTISSSMRVVLRNSKVLARAKVPGVLAQGIMLEEPLPQHPSNTGNSSSSGNSSKGVGPKAAPVPDTSAADTAAAAGRRDQTTTTTTSSAATAAAAAAAGEQGGAVQQYVRAPAHVVVSALRELWPSMEVWQYRLSLPGARGHRKMDAEMCCQADGRDSMQQKLSSSLTAAMASLVDAPGGDSQSPRGFGLW